MKNINKTLLVKGFISSSLMFSSGVFAHTIQSQPQHMHAVPLSLTSTIILGILLIFTGLFILPRIQGRHIHTIATTTFVTGIIAAGVGGKLVTDSMAVTNPDCDITNTNSSTGCLTNASPFLNFEITNNSDDEIIVIAVEDVISLGQTQSSGLKIVELVKGPIKKSIVMDEIPDPCFFPTTLVPGASCFFKHTAQHLVDEGGDGGSN